MVATVQSRCSATARPRRHRPLPNELLFEMAKFARYDGLKRCRLANYRLAKWGQPMLARKHKKLDQLYLDGIRQLADWLTEWTVRSRQIRAKLHKKAFHLLRALVQSRNGGQVGDDELLFEQMAEFGQFASQLDGLYEEVTELRKRVQQIGRDRTDWLALFELDDLSKSRFRALRCRLLDRVQTALFTEICHWGFEDLRKWNELFQRFGGLLQPNMPVEVAQCMHGYNFCAQRAVRTANVLAFSVKFLML